MFDSGPMRKLESTRTFRGFSTYCFITYFLSSSSAFYSNSFPDAVLSFLEVSMSFFSSLGQTERCPDDVSSPSLLFLTLASEKFTILN